MGFMIYYFGFEKNTLPLVDSFATISTMNNNANPNQTTATNSASMTDKIAGAALDNASAASITKEAESYLPFEKSDSINEKKSKDLLLSNPFYSSKDSMVLNKLNLNSMSDSNATKELKIFYELGLINNSKTVHNIGYYIEELRPMAALNESMLDNQIGESLTDNHLKFGKGTGFYLAADADVIGWNAYDQVFNTLGNITKYLGIIYFTTNEIPGGILSSFNNKVGIYEYDLYSNGTAIRNMWLWPVATS